MRTLTIIVFICVFLTAIGVAFAVPPPEKEPPPDLPGSAMWVPWSDFKEILEKLGKVPTPIDPPPPHDALIAGAKYFAKVGENGVDLEIKASVVVLKKKGWAKTPIIRTGVPIASAALNGKPVALVPESDDYLHLVLTGPGVQELSLKLTLDLKKDSGPEHFSMPVVRSQINRLEVRLDRKDQVVMISPKGHMESSNSGNTTVATGSFPPQDRVKISWARSAGKTEKEVARISAEVRTMLTVGEGLGVYTAIVDYDIQHKPISRFQMELPADVSVADVSTNGLVDWKVEKGEDKQTLIVSIAFEAVGRHQVAVTYEKMLPAKDESSFQVSDLIVKDVVHEVGYLAVAVRTNVQVSPKDGNMQNLAQLDPNELPADLRGSGDLKVLYGFKYIKHPVTMELAVTKHKDASVLTCEVERADYKVMVTKRGKQLIEATYRIANRSMQYLTLTLPEGADLWGVYRDGEPVKAAEKDGQILLPIFQGGLNKTFTMKVLAYKKAGKFIPFGRKSIDLPVLDVGTSKAFLELYLPYKFRFFQFGGKLEPGAGAMDVSKVGYKGMDDQEADMRVIEGKVGWSKDADELDKLLEGNIAYRNERSQVSQSIVSIPVSSANPMYANAMTRGALPVEFDISWEGQKRTFHTSILDPEEKAGVTFFYGRVIKCPILSLPAFLLMIFIGYFAAWIVVAKKSELISKPDKKLWKYGLIALVFVIAFGAIKGGSEFKAGFPFVIGVLGMGLRYWLAVRKKKAQEKPPVPIPTAEKVEEAKPVDSDEDQGGEK